MTLKRGRRAGKMSGWDVPVAMLIGAAALIGGLWYVGYRSPDFEYGSRMLGRPILPFVALMMALGLAYCGVAYVLVRRKPQAIWLLWIVCAGIAMRAVLFDSNPILESDYYRYLWDGGVTMSGHNPYAYVPMDVFDAESNVPDDLVSLAKSSGIVAGRVNHPSLATVYPPVAQAAFATAHVAAPWDLQALRAVLLVFDVATFILLLFALRALELPLTWSAIYWWNPLLIKETVNSAHMDVIVLPFALAALLFASSRRPAAACVAGALAVCTKIWPVVLAPILLRYTRADAQTLAIAVLLGALAVIGIASPMHVVSDMPDTSGFFAYGGRWEMNDALFMVFHKLVAIASNPMGLGDHVKLGARIAVGLTLLAVVAALSWSPAKNGASLSNRCAIALGVLFMLSPTQFPWYSVWLAPFLALAPRASLLALTAMLPMYYLKFYYSAMDNVNFFHNRLVWIEYAPVIALAGWEAFRAGKAARA